MNFKKIPADIKSKSIKDAQKEASEIIGILEKEFSDYKQKYMN